MKIRTKRTIRKVAFMLVVTLMMSKTILASDIFKGGLPSVEVKSLKFRYTTNSTYGNKFIVPAANYWNGISSKVSMTSTTSDTAKVSVYAETTTQNGLLGLVVPYYETISGSISEDTNLTKTWIFCDLFGYYNQMQSFNMTDSQIISNYAHEFGHTLSLSHPSSSVTALMKQGIQSIKPQTHDKNNLKAKWGA